jgi:hypothetical protein
MKKLIFTIIMFISLPIFLQSQTQTQTYTYELARSFSRDLFENNGVFYLQPVVKVINATSNSRFYNQAYVPKKVEKPYYRISVNGMYGLVNDNDKVYSPYMPRKQFSINDLDQFGNLDIDFANPANSQFNIQDTAGLIHYFFLNLMYDGIEGQHAGSVTVPNEASTALGSTETYFSLPNDTLKKLAENHFIYPYLPESLRDSLDAVIQLFPERFDLPAGNNLNAVFAAVPQFEIGSIYGTELLLRFIPPLDYGETIGEFAFWGIGVKHSLSQYLPERYFDAAFQFVYQGTRLKNEVGVTQAELTANASFINTNIHFSKQFGEHFIVFSGIAYETVNITSEYVYELPIVVQRQLGLIEEGQEEPTPGFPGDTNPQRTELELNNENYKFKIGAMAKFGNLGIVADYNISNFNIFSFGLEWTF